MGFPGALALHIHDLSGGIVLVVGAVALLLALVGAAALKRSGNRSLLFVVAAFAVFAAKGLYGGWAIQTDSVAHEDLEATLAIADLAVVLLLAAPLVTRFRSRSGAG